MVNDGDPHGGVEGQVVAGCGDGAWASSQQNFQYFSIKRKCHPCRRGVDKDLDSLD